MSMSAEQKQAALTLAKAAVVAAQAALATAKAAYASEVERDSERGEGSGSQERRRDEHLESLRNSVDSRERTLIEAVRTQAQLEGGGSAANR